MKTRSRTCVANASPEVPPGGAGDPSAEESNFWEPLAQAAAASDQSGALERALAILGPLYRADRAWLGRYNAALTHFWGASDWVGPGIVSHFQQMQGVSVDVITSAHRKFLRGESVIVADVDRMPRQSRGLRAELRREGVRSTLGYPLVQGGTLIGFFGFDRVRELAAWTPADLGRLPAIGKFLAGLLHRSLTPGSPSESPATADGCVYVSERSGMRALAIVDIVFIEADGDYSRVHLVDGRRYFELRSLRTWIAQLPRERFLRVHQSYLVSRARIARLDRGPRWTLHLQDIPDPIPVGRSFRHALRLHMGF